MYEYIVIYIIFTTFIFLRWNKVNPRDISKKLHGDSLEHYSLITSIIEHNGRIPLEHKRGPKGKHKVTYPQGYHWLLSKIPGNLMQIFFVNHSLIISSISYSFYSIIFIFLGGRNNIDINSKYYLLFSTLYFFSPYMHNYKEARNFFSVRPVGEFLISSAFLIYINGFFYGFVDYFIIFIFFIAAIFISKFSRQVISFSVLPISLINSDSYYFLVVCLAFFIPVIFSKSYSLSLKGQYYHLKNFYKIVFPLALKHGWMPYGLKKLFTVKDIKSFLKIFPRVNILILFLDYPLVWYFIVNEFLSTQFHHYFYFVLIFCAIAIITSIGKFKIVGEGKRYLDYAYIIAIFYVVLYGNGNITELGILAGYSISSSLLYEIVRFVVNRKIDVSAKSTAIHELIDFIQDLETSTFYCLSVRISNYIEAFSKHRIAVIAGNGPWDNESIKYFSIIRYNLTDGEIDYVLRTERIKYLEENFGVDTILLEKSYSLENEKCCTKIFSNNFFSIYKL